MSDQDRNAMESALALHSTRPHLLLVVMQKENTAGSKGYTNYFPLYLSLYVQPDGAD